MADVDDIALGLDRPIDLPHVFEWLYISRALPMRRKNSSGLGLLIVKELAEAMGGIVVATGNALGGGRFAFRLAVVEH